MSSTDNRRPTSSGGTRSASGQRRPQGARPQGSRPPGSRPSGSRPPGSRPPGSRPSGSRPQGSRPDSVRRATAHSSANANRRAADARQRKKKKNQTIILVVEILVIVFLLVGLLLWMKFGRMNFDTTVDTKDIVVNTELSQETVEVLQGYETIALFGVDNRTNGNYESGNSDSIMICNIDKDTKEVKVVSVYRDTYLNTGNDTYRKCNYAYNHGGPAQAISMLNQCLDLDIKHYVSVDFYALAEVVDALGGVTLNVTEEEAKYINDCYIDPTGEVVGHKAQYVSAGLQTLDGIQAVCYCRVRYTAGDDFKRAWRQRYVLSLLVEKALQADIGTINQIVDGVLPDIATNYTAAEIVALAADMKSYALVHTGGFPSNLTTGLYGKLGSLVVPCTLEYNVTQLHNTLFGTTDYVPSETVRSISNKISNDTGTNTSSGSVVTGDY